MMHDALVVLDLGWSLVVKATTHLSVHLVAKVAVGCQFGKAAKVRSGLQTSQAALVRYCSVGSMPVFEVAVGTRCRDKASRCEHVVRLVLQ